MNCPYCSKVFTSWKSVRGHIPSCKNNTGEYFIDLKLGPIHYEELVGLNQKELKYKFPDINAEFSDIRKTFSKRGYIFPSIAIKWSKENIIKAIQSYYNKHKKIPQQRDSYISIDLPHFWTVQQLFGSWNKGIEAAGFQPNEVNGFGKLTKANDGQVYRSIAEAEFVNKFLFTKYKYEYEPSYEGHFKYYDFYLPELDLYIEIDGELRPEVIQEKIEINIKQNKKFLVIKTKDLYSKQELNDFMWS